SKSESRPSDSSDPPSLKTGNSTTRLLPSKGRYFVHEDENMLGSAFISCDFHPPPDKCQRSGQLLRRHPNRRSLGLLRPINVLWRMGAGGFLWPLLASDSSA